MKLQKRIERLEDRKPNQEPHSMVFKDSNGRYRVHTNNGTERLSKREFQQQERTILMEPIQ